MEGSQRSSEMFELFNQLRTLLWDRHVPELLWLGNEFMFQFLYAGYTKVCTCRPIRSCGMISLMITIITLMKLICGFLIFMYDSFLRVRYNICVIGRLHTDMMNSRKDTHALSRETVSITLGRRQACLAKEQYQSSWLKMKLIQLSKA